MEPLNGSDSLFNFCNYFQSQLQLDQDKLLMSTGKNLNLITNGSLSKDNQCSINGFSPFLSSSSPSSSSPSSPPSTSMNKHQFTERNEDLNLQTLNKNLHSLLNDDLLAIRPKNPNDPVILSSSTTSSSTDKSLNSFCSESNDYDSVNTNQDSLLLNLNGFLNAAAAVGNSSNHNNSCNDQQKPLHHHASHQQQQQQPQQFRENLQSSAFFMSNHHHNYNNQPQQHQTYAFPSSSNSSSPPLSQTSGPSSASSETAVTNNTNVVFNHNNNNNNKPDNANRLNFLDSQNLSSSLAPSSTTNNNTTSPLLSKVITNSFNNQISRKNDNLFHSNINPLDNAFSLMVSNSLSNKNSSTNNIDTTITGQQQDISPLFLRSNNGISLGSSTIDLAGENRSLMAINNNNNNGLRNASSTSLINNVNTNIHPESLLLNSGISSTNNCNSDGNLILGNNSNNQSRSKISPSSFNKNNINCMGKNLASNSNVSPPILTNNNNNNTNINNNNCNNSNQTLFTPNQLAILNDLLEQQQQSTALQQRLLNLNNNNNNNNNLNNLTSSSSTVSGSNISMLTHFDHQIQSLANEINSTVQLYVNSIQMRKEQLLKQLEHVRNAYSLLINQQSTATNNQNNKNKPPITQLPKITFTRPDQNLFKSITSFGFINTPAFGPYCQISGEGLSMAIEGEPTCFSIITRNCFNEEMLIGGENIDIEIQSNETTGQNNLFISNPSFQIQKNILDNNNGKYNVTYTIPRGSGIRSAKIFISINGLLTSNSPYLITVKTERLRENWKLLTLYGEEGTEPGKFCRPWGIAITRLPLQKDPNHKLVGDVNAPNIPMQSKSFYQWQCPNYRKDYLLTVADRSNNRIQILKLSIHENVNNNNNNSSGQFVMSNSSSMAMNKAEISVLHVFGNGPGTRPGLFDRPAGITINSNLGQLIVADKDNHRIQVFDLAGGFLFKFGEKGSRPGQFCYPWDVAICPQTSMILVSDTRNRRIQLFTHYGQYLWHCGQPLDSPRGVAFLTPDRYIISDFNKHRLLIIDRSDSNSHQVINSRDDYITSKYIGFGEGSAWGEFLRPQGLVASIKKNSMVSKYVQVLCADSRNNRIAIYNSLNQNFDYINGDSSMANGATFDRPSGIAIADNILAIIDFGNNRLQIFQNNLG